MYFSAKAIASCRDIGDAVPPSHFYESMYKHCTCGSANYGSLKVCTIFAAIFAAFANLLFFKLPSYKVKVSSLSS